jgi:hypothetical protein
MPDVVAATDRLARAADTLSAEFAASLGRVLREMERALRSVLSTWTETDRTATTLAVRALALRAELRAVLDEAGYDRLARTATSAMVEELAPIVEASRLARALGKFFDPDYDRIRALAELARYNVVAQGDEMAITLWRTLVRGLYGLQPRADLLDDLAATLDDELPTIRTLYDTTTSVFSRQVELLKADDAPTTLFAYMGPADAVMRPFCAKHIGKVYTRREIDQLDNGQLPNVLLTGGGYNCRHTWLELAPESSWAPLAESGDRVPEIVDELARAPKKTKAKAA